MKINIPCPDCGCQTCAAKTKTGEAVTIQICRCNDGSGEYEVSIIPIDGSDIQNEKHQCPSSEIETCISNRFDVDIESMSHNCFN